MITFWRNQIQSKRLPLLLGNGGVKIVVELHEQPLHPCSHRPIWWCGRGWSLLFPVTHRLYSEWAL